MRSSPVRHAIPATTKGLALVGVASCLAMVASIAAVVARENKPRTLVFDAPGANEGPRVRPLTQGWIEPGAVAALDRPPLSATSASPNRSLPGSPTHEPAMAAVVSRPPPSASSVALEDGPTEAVQPSDASTPDAPV